MAKAYPNKDMVNCMESRGVKEDSKYSKLPETVTAQIDEIHVELLKIDDIAESIETVTTYSELAAAFNVMHTAAGKALLVLKRATAQGIPFEDFKEYMLYGKPTPKEDE